MEHHRLLSPDRLVVWAFFILCAAGAEREPLLFVGVGILLFDTLPQQLQCVSVALEAFAGDGGEAG